MFRLELAHQVIPVASGADLDHIAGELRYAISQSVQLVGARDTTTIRWKLRTKGVGDVHDVPSSADFADLARRCTDRFRSSYKVGMRVADVVLSNLASLVLAEQGFLGKQVVDAGKFTCSSRS